MQGTGFKLVYCIDNNNNNNVSRELINSKVEFNRQQANEGVHVLAGVATLLVNLTTYFIVPRCIEHLIINEMI